MMVNNFFLVPADRHLRRIAEGIVSHLGGDSVQREPEAGDEERPHEQQRAVGNFDIVT